ncbi:hypothetical protein IFR05_007645 [Cadophora sp. M221]|nr:hypothetical protein IFR05_007645 [Cadophora sp. M221]
MAKVLREPWLSTAVESELGTAFNTFQNSYVPGPLQLDKDNRSCGPSGIEIRLKKPRQAQITEFQGGRRNPYDAVLSDGTHHIHAIFDKDAAQSFTDSTHRDFHNIKGGIIVIKKYLLIVNSTSSTTRLTLRVLDFKFQGSEGSPTRGRPVDVLTLENVELLVGRLQCLFTLPPEDTQVQFSSTASQDKGSQPSAGFATQLNHSHERAISNPIPAKEEIMSHDSLIAHLVGGAKEPEALVPRSPASITLKTALGPATGAKVAAMNAKLDAKANVQRSQSSTPLNSSSSVQDKDVLKFISNDTGTKGYFISSSDDNEKENNQERAEARKSPSVRPEPAGVVQRHAAILFVDQFQRNDAFEGLKRVPRRFVRILEDQKAMLERSDCWYEPQAGDRLRHANIPAKVMDDLTRFGDRKPTIPQAEVAQLDHSSSDSEEDSEHDSTAEQSENGDGESSVDFGHSRGDQGAMERQQPKDNPPRSTNRNPKGRFSSGNPETVNVAASNGSGNDTDDDDRISWEATPNPEDELPQPVHTPSLHTPSQPRLSNEVASAPTWKPRGKPYARGLISIPSSSPTREDELELAVPHAVGDIVGPEDIQMQTIAKGPQELPSTAPLSSKYIQVKRTPYSKPRSFDEASLRRTGTGSKGAKDVISSSPVIPATFNDTVSSSKQVSSVNDNGLTAEHLGARIEVLHTDREAVRTPITLTQDLNGASSLQSKDETVKGTAAEETVTSRGMEEERSRVSPAKSDVVSKYSTERDPSTHSDYAAASTKIHAPTLEIGNKQQREARGKTASRRSLAAKGADTTTNSSLPQVHLSKRERKSLIYDPKPNGQTAEQLREEGDRIRHDTWRSFRAEVQQVELPRLPPSPVFAQPISNSERSMTPAVAPKPVGRVILSPRPEPPTGIDDNEEVTEPAHETLVEMDPRQDDNAFKERPSSRNAEPINSSPGKSPSSRFNEQSPVSEAVEQESPAFPTPPRRRNEQCSTRESIEPESPFSAQPLTDEVEGQPSPRAAVEPEILTSALSLSQTSENGDRLSFQGTTTVDDLSIARSRINENVEQSPPRQTTQLFKSPSVGAQSLVEDQNPTCEVLQPGASICINQPTNKVRDQPQVGRTFETRDLPSVKPLTGLNRQKNSQLGAAKSLTFEGFLSTYPEYAGDKRCFTRALVCLEWLRAQRIPHWSICDDFIRAYAEFEIFVRKHAEDLMTAWDYYDRYVVNPVFQKRIIDNDGKLAAALSLLNPLYVKLVRDRYNAPAADTPLRKAPSRKRSKATGAQVQDSPTTKYPSTTQVKEKGGSPELGAVDMLSRRHARKPFFETPSQLHSVQTRGKGGSTISVPDVGSSEKKRRSLPWQQARGNQNQISSSPESGSRRDRNDGSSEAKKRRRSDDHRRASIPPLLRASSFKSPTATGQEKPHRPSSRDGEVFETRLALERGSHAARASPELPDFTEKWVAQLVLADDLVMEEPNHAGSSNAQLRKVVGVPLTSRRQSGLSSNADSPKPTRKRPYRDMAEAVKAIARRRVSGLSSEASTPYSTPAKRFCTKPKTATPVKRVENAEPETQEWQ